MISILATVWLSGSAHAVILFVDLNNAPREYAACKRGAGEENVSVVSRTFNSDDEHPTGQPVNIAFVRRKIEIMEANGQKIDSIVISGHDGSGHFMGLDGGGDFYHSDLTKLLAERESTGKSVTSLGLIGCYPNNVHGAKIYWLNPNPNVKMTVGFAVQSPTKEKAATGNLVEAYCKNRQEWVNKQSKSELCDIYPKFNAPFAGLGLTMCSREAVAGESYKKDGNQCFTYQEMQDRCGEFDPGDKEANMYSKYMSANNPCEPQYANPPVDKNSIYSGGASPLRKFYSKVHLWRHCADDFKKNRKHIDPRDGTESAYNLPNAPEVIRLVKYDDIKTNIARLNDAEIREYDQRLDDLCLGQYKLGDITQLNRGEMNRRIENATRSLMMTPNVANTYGLNDEAYPSAADPGLTPDSGARAPASSALIDIDDDDTPPAPAPRPARAQPRPVVPPTPSLPPAPAQLASPAASLPPRRSVPAPAPPASAPASTVPSNPTAPTSAPAPNCGVPEPRPARACQSPRTNPAVVHRMAQGLKKTFVDLTYFAGQWSAKPGQSTFRMCSHFHLVEPAAETKYKSQCVMSYRDAKTVPDGVF